MGVGLGLTGFLGFGQESTYGTPVARTNFLEINEESIETNEGRIESAALAQVGIRNTKLAQGGISVEGDFSFDAQYSGWERLMKHLMGKVTSSQPDVTSNPTVWDHAFTIADQLPTGLTIEVFRGTETFVTEPNKSFIYEGCLLTSGAFSCGVDDLLNCSFSMMGEDENRGAKSSPTYSSSKLAVYHQGTILWNNDDVEASEFSFTINNVLEMRPKLGSRRTRPPTRSGKLEVTGTIMMEFVSWSQYDDFRNATERTFKATFIGDTITGTFKNTITIDVPIAVIMGHRVTLEAPGRIQMEIDFKAYRTDVAGELTFTMRNNTTASLAN